MRFIEKRLNFANIKNKNGAQAAAKSVACIYLINRLPMELIFEVKRVQIGSSVNSKVIFFLCSLREPSKRQGSEEHQVMMVSSKKKERKTQTFGQRSTQRI